MPQIDTFGFSEILQTVAIVMGDEYAVQFRSIADGIPDESYRLRWAKGMLRYMQTGDKRHIVELTQFKYQPVSVRTFIEDPYYLDAKGILYPEVLRCTEEMNNGEYQESILTGAIGTGKSTIALYSTAYQLFLLSCYRNPHELFGLDPSSEIVFIFQSITAALAKSVDYDRFKSMIEKSKYFREHFPFSKDIISELRFPNRIIVKPVSGSETGAIGQNVIGGVIDEMNFMAVVEKSKNTMDGTSYDQATALYNSISKRRKSRFMKAGKVPGLLCLVSSKRYPGQFTDVKEAEQRREIAATGKSSIYVYDKRVWDIKPPGTFSGKWFSIFVGDATRRPRIIGSTEIMNAVDEPLVMSIPEEYRQDFETDMLHALRDIAGVSTLSSSPFMGLTEKVSACFGTYSDVCDSDKVDFINTRPSLFQKRILTNYPRFAHIDLAIKGDSAGLVIGHCPKFVDVHRGDRIEKLPVIAVDVCLEICAPPNGEIEFANIRKVLYKLRELGMPISWVTLDSFQSVDTMQILRGEGFRTGYQSVDTTIMPYQLLKAAFYDGRIKIAHKPKLLHEVLTLEMDFKKGKVDHPPHGSKDIADALAGVVYGLTMRREVWNSHNMNPLNSVSIITQMDREDRRPTAIGNSPTEATPLIGRRQGMSNDGHRFLG